MGVGWTGAMVRARAQAAGGTHGEVLGWVSLEAELRQGVNSKDCT